MAKADTKLFNQASQVVLVRDGDRTVLTMANDFKGDPKEFALVVPVPTVLEQEQIHVGDKRPARAPRRLLGAAARRVLRRGPVPARCYREAGGAGRRGRRLATAGRSERAPSLGVTIEAQYTVGEYDILILSAKQSQGLETWLRENGYRIPAGALRGCSAATSSRT